MQKSNLEPSLQQSGSVLSNDPIADKHLPFMDKTVRGEYAPRGGENGENGENGEKTTNKNAY